MSVGNRSLSQPTLASTPTSGWSRNSHIRLATATDVATVDEKIVRNTPMPLSVLWASIARPTPSTSPSGTVNRANLTVTHSAFWNSTRTERVPVLVPPVRAAVRAVHVAALLPEHDRPDQRVDDERPEDHHRRREQSQRGRQLPPPLSSATPRRHALHPTPTARHRERYEWLVRCPASMDGRHTLLRRFGLIALVAVVIAVASRRRHRRRPAEPVASVAVTDASDDRDRGRDGGAVDEPTTPADRRSPRSTRRRADRQPPATPAPAAPTLDLEQIERDLEGVAMALARLDDGTYWTDEVTGEPLVDELLVADPVARRNR